MSKRRRIVLPAAAALFDPINISEDQCRLLQGIDFDANMDINLAIRDAINRLLILIPVQVCQVVHNPSNP